MKRILTALVIGLSLVVGTAKADLQIFGKATYEQLDLASRLQIQSALTDAGVYKSQIDGKWGRRTAYGVKAAIRYVEEKNKQNRNFRMNVQSIFAFERLYHLIQTKQILSTSPADIECLQNGSAGSCQRNGQSPKEQENLRATITKDAPPTSQHVSNDIPDANGQCRTPTAIPVGTANSPSMVLLSKALKAKKLLEQGTIESRYEAATVVYNSISEIATEHASSEVGIGLLSGSCYGGVSLTTAKNDFIDAYSAFKSGACDSSPTRECLIAKALTTANAACGAGLNGYYPPPDGYPPGQIVGPNSGDSYSAAELALAAIAEADRGLNDNIISDISEGVFRGCIDVMDNFDFGVYVPALIIKYIGHKISIKDPKLAKENLKLLTGSDKLEAVFLILLNDRKMDEKIFRQIESFIGEQDVGGADKFLMSLMLIEQSYKKGFSPNSNFFNDARKIQYNPQRAFESGEGHTCSDYAPLYEAKLVSALKYASLIGNEVSDDKWSWLIRSPIFSNCSSPYELKSDDLRTIRLEALITMLRTQPFERANQIFNYLVNVESKLNPINASRNYKFVIAEKMADEFNVMDKNSKEIGFNENNCSWYQKFFEGENCPQWNLGTLGSGLQMRYLSKNNPCEAVKFMFNVSNEHPKNQTFPSWFTAEQIREAKNKPAQIDSNLLQLAMTEIDWTQAPNCGDAELELLLKE